MGAILATRVSSAKCHKAVATLLVFESSRKNPRNFSPLQKFRFETKQDSNQQLCAGDSSNEITLSFILRNPFLIETRKSFDGKFRKSDNI
jgi:flagellar assembly factor FliW